MKNKKELPAKKQEALEISVDNRPKPSLSATMLRWRNDLLRRGYIPVVYTFNMAVSLFIFKIKKDKLSEYELRTFIHTIPAGRPVAGEPAA